MSAEVVVAALDKEEACRLAANFSRSLCSAVVTKGGLEGPAVEEDATLEDADAELLLAADMNFW